VLVDVFILLAVVTGNGVARQIVKARLVHLAGLSDSAATSLIVSLARHLNNILNYFM